MALATGLTLAGASSARGAKAAPNGVATPSALRHHSEMRHAAQIRHADRVRAAERRAQYVRLTTAWGRVAVCEEGGWGNSGAPLFPNSLGIMAGPPGGWYGHGGGGDLRPWTQIKVARLEILSLVGQNVQGTTVYPGFVPDQSGCSAW